MSHETRFADTFPVAAMVSTLSRHLRWNHFVNLHQMHKDDITLAKHWTELQPKAELEQHLHLALIDTRERLAWQGVDG